MAQTTDAISFKDAKIEVSDDGITWTDASGFSNKVGIGGGERMSAEFFTADGESPIFTVGKRGMMELTCNVVYTEGATDPTTMIMDSYENGTALYLRWSPAGGATGDWQYTSDPGNVLTPVYPGGDASQPDAVVMEFTLKCSKLTKSVVA